MYLMVSLTMVDADVTVGIPTTTTGTPKFSFDSSFLLLPIPEPGAIPASDTWILLFNLDMDDEDTAPTIEDLRAEIQGKLRTASAEVKKKAKEILITEATDPEKIKLADATVETLNKILAILD